MKSLNEQINSKYVDVKTACEILGVSRTTLVNHARAGRLKRFESGVPVRTYYDRAQLEAVRMIKPKYQ